MLKAGRLPAMLKAAKKPPRNSIRVCGSVAVCELNVSISEQSERCNRVSEAAGGSHPILQWEALGLTAVEYARMGVERDHVLRLKQAFSGGSYSQEGITSLDLLDHMGSEPTMPRAPPEEVRDQIIEPPEDAGPAWR